VKKVLYLFFVILTCLGLGLQAMDTPAAQNHQNLTPAQKAVKLENAIKAGNVEDVKKWIDGGAPCSDVKLLESAVRCLVNQAKSGRSINSAVQILQILKIAITCTITITEQTALAIILEEGFIRGNAAEPGKKPLPMECAALVGTCPPLFTVSSVPTPVNPENSAQSLFTIPNKPILLLCACALVCVGAYAYWCAQEDSEISEEPESSENPVS